MGADQVRRQYRADESFPHVFDKTAGGSRVQVRRRLLQRTVRAAREY